MSTVELNLHALKISERLKMQEELLSKSIEGLLVLQKNIEKLKSEFELERNEIKGVVSMMNLTALQGIISERVLISHLVEAGFLHKDKFDQQCDLEISIALEDQRKIIEESQRNILKPDCNIEG